MSGIGLGSNLVKSVTSPACSQVPGSIGTGIGPSGAASTEKGKAHGHQSNLSQTYLNRSSLSGNQQQLRASSREKLPGISLHQRQQMFNQRCENQIFNQI